MMLALSAETVATAAALVGSVCLLALGGWVASLKPRTNASKALAAYAALMALGMVGATLPPMAWNAIVVPVATISAGSVFMGLMWWVSPAEAAVRRKSLRLAAIPVLVFGVALIIGLSTDIADLRSTGGRLSSLGTYLAAEGSWVITQGMMWSGMTYLATSRFLTRGAALPNSRAAVILVGGALHPALNVGSNLLGLSSTPIIVAFFVVVTIGFLIAATAQRDTAARNAGLAILATLLSGMILGVTIGASPLTLGLGLLASTLVLAYGVVRHQVVGVDVRVRWGISKSTIAAIFIAVFFMASEGAQQFFGDTLGSTYVGIGAAGALVFALAPLQRFADGIAARAVPTPTKMSGDARYAHYRRQVELAWADGQIGRKERAMLRATSDALQLTADEVSAIEREVEGT